MTTSKHLKVRRGNYYFCRRVNGTLIRKVLGKVSEISAEDAERMGNELVGRPPKQVAPKQVAPRGTTLAELWTRYLNVYAKTHKRSWQQDEALYEYHLAKQYGQQEARVFDLAAVHASIGAARGKVVANHVYNLVSRMFKVSDMVAPKVKKYKERSRERFLSHDEVARLLAAIETSSIRDFVLVCLYTGSRSGNVRCMQWSEVDLSGKTWTVPAEKSKNGRSLRVHLCDKVLTVLRAREKVDGSDYVFCQRPGGGSTVLDSPMVQPRKMWLKLCKRAGLENVTIHDLRRNTWFSSCHEWREHGGHRQSARARRPQEYRSVCSPVAFGRSRGGGQCRRYLLAGPVATRLSRRPLRPAQDAIGWYYLPRPPMLGPTRPWRVSHPRSGKS